MNELVLNIKNIVNQINEVVELFYQQDTKEAYGRLDRVLGDLMIVVDPVHQYQEGNPDCLIDTEGLMEALKETLSAMEDKDAILTADLLKYEVNEKLETIINAIK